MSTNTPTTTLSSSPSVAVVNVNVNKTEMEMDKEIETTIEASASPKVTITTQSELIPRIKVLSASFIQTYPSARTCFVLGSTGESGKRLARDLINSGAFSLVKLIARRPVPDEFVPEPPVGVKIVRFVACVYMK